MLLLTIEKIINIIHCQNDNTNHEFDKSNNKCSHFYQNMSGYINFIPNKMLRFAKSNIGIRNLHLYILILL